MVKHRSKNKTTAKKAAKRFRGKGLKASVAKDKTGWNVYTYRK